MTIKFTQEGSVGTLLLNRPEHKNALTVEMRQDILTHMSRAASDDTLRAIVITGAGDAFCAGIDVGGMGGRALAASRARLRALQQAVLAIYSLEKPVIAAVRGAVVGAGWSIALACDWVVASNTSHFSQIFQRMGLAPDGGSAWFLTRNIGMLRAKDLVYSARMVNANEAASLGLVSQVVADAELLTAAHAVATRLAAGPSFALALSKKMLHASIGPSLEEFFETELLIQSQLTQTDDYREGIQAFKEKRLPRFTGS